MRRGKIIQVGKAEDLYHNPAELFVARLFSEINEVPCRVKGGAVQTPLGNFPAPGLKEGKEAILCLRQRGIRVLPPGQGLLGRVLQVKFLGDVGRVEIAVQGFEAPLKARVRENEDKAKEPCCNEVRASDGSQRILVGLHKKLDAKVVREWPLGEEDTFVCRDSALTDELAANLALQCRLKTV